jgi:hypothetical protein
MMKRLIQLLVVVLVSVATTTPMKAWGWETNIFYFSDDTFQTYVGEWDQYCDLSQYSTGSTGPWRVLDVYSCDTGQQTQHRCQESDGMGGWITVGCPPGV